MVEKITDVVLEVEGIPAVRNATTDLINEVAMGDGEVGARHSRSRK